MKPDDITRTFVEDNFGRYYDEKLGKMMEPRYLLTDKVILNPKEYYNASRMVTTLGRILTYKMIFEAHLTNIIGFINEPLTNDRLTSLEEIISNAILDKKITTDIAADYYNRVQWVGLALHSFLCGSFTENTIKPLPQVIALRKKLYEQYAEELKGPQAGVVAANIEKQLIAEAKKILKDDPGMDLYNSGARGSFGNNYKNMMITKGPVYNNVTKKFDVISNSLVEGIQKEDIPSFGSQVIAGSYPKLSGAYASNSI